MGPWDKAIALGALFLVCACADRSTGPEQAFAAFKQALNESDMLALNSLASESTQDYLSSLQPWIVRGDEDSLKSLQPFDRYMVLIIRMHLDELERADWQDWNRALMSDSPPVAVGGFLGELLDEAFSEASIGQVDSIRGVTAGRLMRRGISLGTNLGFSKESDGWKINIARYFRDSFDAKMKPYLSDRYRNRDRVWEMLKENYGDRMKRELFASRLENIQ